MQNTYAQNSEDLFVLNYFGDYKGTLLEIGANDGTTLSNSRLLIEHGWKAILFEPGRTVFMDLASLHCRNENVKLFPYGLGSKNECTTLYESGSHVKNGTDKGLVSTCVFNETLRWPDVEFTKRDITLITFDKFYTDNNNPQIDFISIDAEGNDWLILQQIDLEKVGCKCLIIEWNSKPELLKLFTDYCHGYRLEVVNAENLIFVK